MGIFGEIPISTKVPTFIGKPIEDIKAVNAELYSKYQKNKESMDSIEIQMSKINSFDEDKPYIKELSENIKSKFETIKNNPFEMPFANTMVSDTFKDDIILNKQLNAIIKRKGDNDSIIQSLLDLKKGSVSATDGMTSSSKTKANIDEYTQDSIDYALLYHKSINRGPTMIDENGSILNPIKSYTPVAYPDMTKEIIDAISKMPTNKRESYIGKNNIQGAPDEYYIKRQIESKTKEEIYNLGKTLLSDNPKFNEWVNQEVFFEKIRNTERDENGLLKFKENGELAVNYNQDELFYNEQFRNYLTNKYETLNNKNQRVALNKDIGKIGSDNNLFKLYFSNQNRLEKEYLEFTHDKVAYSSLASIANAYDIENKTYDEIKNELFILKYKQKLDIDTQTTARATVAPTAIETESLLNLKNEKSKWNSEILSYKNPNTNKENKFNNLNNLNYILAKSTENISKVINKLDLNNEKVVNSLILGLENAIENNSFIGLENFSDNQNLKQISSILNKPIKQQNGELLNNREKAIYIYNTFLKKDKTNFKNTMSFLSAYSQLNSSDSNSKMIDRIQKISTENNIDTFNISNSEMVSIPIKANSIRTEGGKVIPHPMSQYFENHNNSVSDNTTDYHVFGFNTSKGMFLNENKFRKIIKGDKIEVNPSEIRFKATGNLSKNPIDGYYGAMKYEMTDKQGNPIYLYDEENEKLITNSLMMANNNKAQGANFAYEVSGMLSDNNLNDQNTINIGNEIKKNVIVGSVDNLLTSGYNGIQQVNIILPANLTKENFDREGKLSVKIINNPDGTFNVLKVKDFINDNGEVSYSTEKLGGTFRDKENFKTFLYNSLLNK